MEDLDFFECCLDDGFCPDNSFCRSCSYYSNCFRVVKH